MAAAQAPARRNDGRFRAQFRKTELCAYFMKGWCSKGGHCEFAHGEAELQVAPDLTKTSLCRRWLKYQCMLTSEECPFAHGKHELRATAAFVPTPCRQRAAQQAAQQHGALWAGPDAGNAGDLGDRGGTELRQEALQQPAMPCLAGQAYDTPIARQEALHQPAMPCPAGQAYGTPMECLPVMVAHRPAPGPWQCGANMYVGALIPSAAITPVPVLLPPATAAPPPPAPAVVPAPAPFRVEKPPGTDEARQLSVNRTCAELLAKAAAQAVSPTPESVQAILLHAVPEIYED